MERTNNAKYDEFRLWYTHGAQLIGNHKLPQLALQHHVPYDVRSWNERNGIKDPQSHWIDFFIDDYQFQPLWNALVGCVEYDCPAIEQLWRRIDSYMQALRRFAGVIATDFSMLPEMLPDQRNWNCARNRIMAYYLESNAIPTIPVACWCSQEDFSWCFDGLPSDSTVAISTNGCLSSAWSKQVLLDGVEELIRQKSPWLLVICGREVPEIRQLCDNVMYYPSFAQRMKRRVQHG